MAQWPPGLPHSLDYPEVPVGAVLAGAARRFGDRTAFHYAGRDLSFAQLWRQACQFAHALRDNGVGKGSVVAMHMPNCPQYPIAYYGTMLAGATFCPVNPLQPADDLVFQLTDADAVVAVTYQPLDATLAGVRPRTGVRLAVVTGHDQSLDPSVRVDPSAFGDAGVDFEAFCEGRPEDPPAVDIDVGRDLAHLAYTGGTTGRSKGVELPHRNVITNSLQYACFGNGAVPALDGHGGLVLDQIGAPEEWSTRLGTGRGINLTPWFHAMGTIGGLNVPMLAGGTTIIHLRFDPGAYLADAEKFQVTTMGGAPPIFIALLLHPDIHTRDLSSVRGISSGAAPLPVDVIEALRKRFPDATIAEGYGLTEVTMGATMNPSYRSALRKVGSVGVPVFDTEVKIVPAEGGEESLPAGAEGEVCIRGPQVMVGYHDRPEETEAVLVDGWLHTGDIGVLDEDGYLTIVDRKKDMLLYKGYNVYPRELEEILFRHPAIANAAVVGRADPAAGELPIAFVARAEGHDELAAEDVMAYVNERVAPYKRVREVRFVDSIPVSAAGKVLKRELRQLLAAET
ncbi:MAG: AMP-binding protein [Streptosporangiales bacterium]|nr:AMP-binding protein [Streptosporangiales bacterium]